MHVPQWTRETADLLYSSDNTDAFCGKGNVAMRLFALGKVLQGKPINVPRDIHDNAESYQEPKRSNEKSVILNLKRHVKKCIEDEQDG